MNEGAGPWARFSLRARHGSVFLGTLSSVLLASEASESQVHDGSDSAVRCPHGDVRVRGAATSAHAFGSPREIAVQSAGSGRVPSTGRVSGGHCTGSCSLAARLQRGRPHSRIGRVPPVSLRRPAPPACSAVLSINPQLPTRSLNLQPGRLPKYCYGGRGQVNAGSARGGLEHGLSKNRPPATKRPGVTTATCVQGFRAKVHLERFSCWPLGRLRPSGSRALQSRSPA